MEQSKAKRNIRELPKGVEINSLSIIVTFIKIAIHITIICAKMRLKVLKSLNQKSHTEVQTRLPLYNFIQIFSPTTIKLARAQSTEKE